MLRIIKCQKGSTLVFAAIVMVAMIGFTALAIDTGMILTADHQLQSAVDAAALAGASGLLLNQGVATNRAVAVSALNNCINRAVVINAGNVSYPTPTRIRVQANRQVNLFIAPILGVNTSTVTAVSSALVDKISETTRLKPWAIPNLNWNVGEPVVLKAGSLGAPSTNPSFFYAIDYPPVNKGTPNTGANNYRQAVETNYPGTVTINDVIQVEPGNMTGPTKQGVDYVMAQDPGAFWDDQTGTVLGSNYPGYSSPRIIKIPFYDPNDPPSTGRKTITVTGLGSFFLEGVTNNGDVIGRFMKITTDGNNKGGPGVGLLYKVKLVE